LVSLARTLTLLRYYIRNINSHTCHNVTCKGHNRFNCCRLYNTRH